MSGADSLWGLLADRGIKLRRLDPGHTEHVLCPRCGGGKHREHSLAVTIDDDGSGAVWTCHRGTCGWTENVRVRHDEAPRPRARRQENDKPIPQHDIWQTTERPEWLYRFFADRRIGATTVDRFGVYAMNRHFPGLGERPAIVFPYRHQGEVVARKYRPHPDKSPQSQENTGPATLFNADVLDGAETIYFVEGEPDVMAMVECGYTTTVSLRDGAPAEARFREDDRRFAALATHSDAIGKVKRFVLAGDMDGPGLALREELARRLGRHRCWLVSWPDGCKDACDALTLGFEFLQGAIEAAEKYPIEDVISPDGGMLIAIRDEPIPPTMGVGTFRTDQVIKFPTEGRLIVITGYTTHGKSSWTREAMLRSAQQHNRRWLVFTPEHNPPREFLRSCVTWLIGKRFDRSVTDDETLKIGDWMKGRITIMSRDPIKQPPTLDWIVDTATQVVLRDGITDLLIDPWNEIMHTRGDLSETDYVGRSLQVLKAFGLHHGCNVWVCAHPPKPPPTRNGEERKKLDGYDIAGSAHWANKADIGVTVWSDQAGITELIVWKARFDRWSEGGVVRVEYDPKCGRYRDPPFPDESTKKHWSDGQ